MRFLKATRGTVKCLGTLLASGIAGLGLVAGAAQAADEDAFLGQVRSASEQVVGQGHSALWTLPEVATQYQPLQATPAMQAALQAQHEGRFLDALIQLDKAGNSGQASADAETNLLRASFLLQGEQARQALEILLPLLASPRHAADAYALTAMAQLQQGQLREALDAAEHAGHAQSSGGDMLPPLALSYALQGMGQLAQAREVVHGFNTHSPQSAIALAREAELALTLDQLRQARTLAGQARDADAAHPYVIAVSGLVDLIDGRAQQAKAEFATALRRDPKDARALMGLGLAEIRLGNFQGGQEKLQAANEADPGNALILTYLGRSQQNLGQTGAATASWRSAEQADPKDPVPWLYQAQAELQANRPLDARDSLREAQARSANRAVYRGARLLQEDEQLLQANLAEVQRQLGLDSLAFHTLSDSVGEKNSSDLRNQADVLQGQPFAESARRSLLLQSMFNEKPGNLPAELDVYGDGAGQTGAAVPQHGAISGLGAQQASYNSYDALFSKNTTLAADAISGSQNTNGEQVRAGVGSDTLGLGIAQTQFKTDGFGSFNNLDNRIWQATVQWRATLFTQVFASYQSFNSRHGEVTIPADPNYNAVSHQYEDISGITRLGLRHTLDDNSELRALLSRQQTSQTDNREWMSDFLSPSNLAYTGPPGSNVFLYHNSSAAASAELQYRRSGAGYAAQWGMSSARSGLDLQSSGSPTITHIAQQIYADWQQTLNPYWQLETGLAWGKKDRLMLTAANQDVSTYLRRWLPKLGLVYTPDSSTHVRLAAWKGLDDAAVGNASLAPATLAGFVLNRPNETNMLARSIALGADKQLDSAWLVEGQAQRRWTDTAVINSSQIMLPALVDESRLALHWQPGAVNVTLGYDDESNWVVPTLITNNSVQQQHLRSEQLDLRWLASSQWTANLGWSHNLLDAKQQAFFPNGSVLCCLIDVPQTFNLIDVDLNWQFNRVGSMEIGVRNATNQTILYTEIDPLNPRFSNGRLTYARLKLAW